NTEPLRRFESFVVAGVGVADDAHAGVGGQHALEAGGGFGSAVGYDDLAGVDAVTDAHAAAVVHRYPGGPANGVEQGVEDGPVSDGVAAVLHGLGLAIGRGHAAGVEVIA